MSLRRTPPKGRSGLPELERSLSLSTPNITETSSISTRPLKRKQGDELEDIFHRMEDMFRTMRDEQNSKLDAALSKITEQHKELTKSISFISEQYEDMKSTIETLLKEKTNNLSYIQTLEGKIEYLEKKTRSTSVELRNIPIVNNENTSVLCDTIVKIGKIVKIPLQQSDIKNVYRINKRNDNKPVIVEFISDIVKSNFLRSTKYSKKTDKNSLTSTALGIDGPVKQIYISEFLTSKANRLFFLARDYANSHAFEYVWTAYGNIYLRKKQGDSAIRINNEDDLKKLTSK